MSMTEQQVVDGVRGALLELRDESLIQRQELELLQERNFEKPGSCDQRILELQLYLEGWHHASNIIMKHLGDQT